MLLSLDDLEDRIKTDLNFKKGCIVDTNILFAASFPLDTFNEWAEKVFEILHSNQIPIYTNINVRSEFIELNRRVLIPEGLIDLHDQIAGQVESEIDQALKSLKTRKAKAAKEDKTFKFNDQDIKRYRDLLEEYASDTGVNGWELFCKDFFHPYITNVWEEATTELRVQFLGSREIEAQQHFNSRPKWENMVDILGKYGIGASDAMIVNLFVNSKFSFIVTTDSDVAKAIEGMGLPNKYALAP